MALCRDHSLGVIVFALTFSLVLTSPSSASSSLAPEIELRSCPNLCSFRGLCIEGICICDATFSGPDCSVGNFSLRQPMPREGILQGLRSRRLPSAPSTDRGVSVDSGAALYLDRLPSRAGRSGTGLDVENSANEAEKKSLNICFVVPRYAQLDAASVRSAVHPVGMGSGGRDLDSATGSASVMVLAESLAVVGHKVHIVFEPGSREFARRHSSKAADRHESDGFKSKLGLEETDGSVNEDEALHVDHGHGELGLVITRLHESDLRHPSAHLAHSYDVYQWLRKQDEPFDVIHFVGPSSLPYYSLLAKRQGLAFQSTAVSVVALTPCRHTSTSGSSSVPPAFSSRLSSVKEEEDLPGAVDMLEVEYMERLSVGMADMLLAPHMAFLDAAVGHLGWELPDDTFVDHEVLSTSDFFSVASRWRSFHHWAIARHAGSHLLESTQHQPMAAEVASAPANVARLQSEVPLVSVIMVHRNRPTMLKLAITSIEKQDYQNLEVVLVDDGSDIPEALEMLSSLESTFAGRGWRMIRQANKYLGAARNAGARLARGQYLLFMDDDNIAMPHEVSTLVRAARSTNADVTTSLINFFSGSGLPADSDQGRPPFLFLGGAAAVGAFRNCYGDANSLVKLSSFQAAGGFTTDFGVGYEDWEFFAKVTMMGMQVQVVPEALYWYRFTPASMQRSTHPRHNRERSLRPYMSNMPKSLSHLLSESQDNGNGNLRSGIRPARAGSARALLQDEFYGFYGWDFYGNGQASLTPTPSPTIGPPALVVLTLNASVIASPPNAPFFNATALQLVEWSAKYLNVSSSVLDVSINTSPEGYIVVTYTVQDYVPEITLSSLPTTSNVLAVKLGAVRWLAGYQVLSASISIDQQQSGTAAPQSGSSGIPVLYWAPAVAVVGACLLAVAAWLAISASRSSLAASHMAYDMNRIRDDNVVYV
mmetsp:Transcript_31074/g.50264  ORF Transcript_31074/g.50264 Transcript_31074/m.50264 type:complete len:935 (-) Transcript_31074:991-3795(-)